MKMKQIASVLGVSAIVALGSPALAQTSGTPGNTTGTTDTTTTLADDRDDNDADYGWLGLLGLSGLAGLLKKPERHVVHQTDTTRNDYTNR